MAEAEAASTKAAAEVAELASQFAQERANTPLATSPQAALAGESAPGPGFVSVAFAEEKWAEREAAFAMQIAQLQALVTASADGAAASEPGDTEAGDHLSLEDDEVWNKVERGQRRTLVRKEKEVLAKKLRTGLGKMPSISSPFKKG